MSARLSLFKSPSLEDKIFHPFGTSLVMLGDGFARESDGNVQRQSKVIATLIGFLIICIVLQILGCSDQYQKAYFLS
ncbi:hypothetical protein [Acinetobacter sp. KS-LM10]|uniref:hypothetical protein n=1 Tax=Acinetobacter sp. KS-LM10 TaxID=3120518 RepID=UPI0030D4319A